MEKVYFIKELSSESLIKLFQKLNPKLPKPMAIKLHSGEAGNQNYLTPEFLKPIIDYLGGTVVECNTAYDGERNTSEKHLKLLKEHGWSKYFKVDLLDEEGPDYILDIPHGKRIKKNYVGKNLLNYKSLVVLSHFKGHPMGGYGGALKQLSIGCASSYGKAYIHGAGVPEEIWTAEHNSFLESMADAAWSVDKLFKGNVVYINVLKNMSVDCDCCSIAEDPCIKDIGALISYDPVAIDQASIDLVLKSNDPGKEHFMERVNSRNGLHTINEAEQRGIGSKQYELIEIE